MNYNPTTISRMREYAESVLSNLTPTDVRISGSLRIAHPNGSSSVVPAAFAEKAGDWLLVFSASEGYLVYPAENVESWSPASAFKPMQIGQKPVAQGRIRKNNPATRAA